MNCFNCGTGNVEGARFCIQCGQALTKTCQHCGTELPGNARFCHNCGRPQETSNVPIGATNAPPVPAVSNSRLRQYIPTELLARLENLRAEGDDGGHSGERRIVTMLFCDVKGSTAAAGKLDPEEWADIINGAFEGMIRPVYRYEGMVARLMGDGILAFFGAPIAHEDDPQRAALAALDILAAIREYREEIRRAWGVELDVRVGINTGMVVVGAVGSSLRLEYTALGDAINLAARMEQTAVPGTIQVSADTHRLIAPLFDFEPLGEIGVKGKEQPVSTFRLLGRKTLTTRLRGIAGLEAPLIGREAEIVVLQERLSALAQGRGGIVFITGEAGLGKSRLIGEGRRLWEATGVGGWQESASLSFESGQPYGLFQRLLRRVLGVAAVDSPATTRLQLQELLAALMEEDDSGPTPEEWQRIGDVLDKLLTGESAGSRPVLEGEAFHQALHWAVPRLAEALARRRPTVWVLDDLHWSDAASLEMLGEMLSLAGGVPLLFLCATRPDPATITFLEDYNGDAVWIRLKPLNEVESGRLLVGLFHEVDLPAALRTQILDRAGGNPFFVEEVVRTLIEGNTIVRSVDGQWTVAGDASRIDLPQTLQGLLTARIDRLAEEARQTLQLASVIGRTFYYTVLARLASSASLDSDLGVLTMADLIREASRLPQLEYAFTHALTQEAAYHSILLKRRRLYHRRVAEAMEMIFAERLEEMSDTLALHYAAARVPARAAHYHNMAGDRAFRLYANAEAAAHYRQALVLLRNSDEADQQLVARVFHQLGRALELRAEYESALSLYEDLERWAAEHDRPDLALSSLLARATIRTTANTTYNAAEATALLMRARELAHSSGDRAGEARILWNLLLLSTMEGGDAAERLRFGLEAVAIARDLDLRDLVLIILHDLWYAYGGLGRWREALSPLQEVEALSARTENLPILAESLTRRYYTHILLGEYDTALPLAEESYRIGETTGNVEGMSISRSFIGLVHLDRGEIDRGLAIMEQAVELGRQVDGVTALIGTQAELGWAYGWLGDLERGRPVVDAAVTFAEKHMVNLIGWSLAPLARLHLLAGELAAAEAALDRLGSFRQQRSRTGFVPYVWIAVGLAQVELALAKGDFASAINTATDMLAQFHADGIRFHLADAYYLRGRARLAIGDPVAHDDLRMAESIAREMGDRRILWWVLSARLELLKTTDLPMAQALVMEGRDIARQLTASLADPRMRKLLMAEARHRGWVGVRADSKEGKA